MLFFTSVAGACPNDLLRSELRSGELPDCRAYELVSPTYKEGTFILSALVAADGNHVISGSLGTFAGAESAEVTPTSLFGATPYEYSRTGSGWNAKSIAPAVSKYQGQGLRDVSADFEGSVWLLRTLTQPDGVTDLYLERPVGTFTEIGPATPEPNVVNRSKYSYVGASADLSHVVFSTEREDPLLRWPFDTTDFGSSTLYEYVSTGHASPSLVGVGGGSASTTLVSRCGTRLGSSTPEEGNGSMYNAISETGARLFFTAVGQDDHKCLGGGAAVEPSVDELLAREELPSGEARTVPVSQPSLSHCAEAPSPPCADANFEGAARDGSSVFFTSTQRLLPGAGEDVLAGDSAVTRGCTQVSAPGCNLYEYDFGPTGQGLALVSQGASEPEAEGAQVQGVARISTDGTHVYFVAKGILAQAPNGIGDKAQVGQDNLYLSVRECPGANICASPQRRVVFVATLAGSDEQDWRRADTRPVLVSRDGRFLVFTSSNDLTREHTRAGIAQVFQYDALTNRLVRASIGQAGYNDNGREPIFGSALAVASAPYISLIADGGYTSSDSPATEVATLAPENGAVFFQSADPLTSRALVDKVDQRDLVHEPIPNIYEYLNGSVYLISDGQDTSSVAEGSGVRLMGSSASGADLFFTTSSRLIPQDTDTQQDIYDARIAGGFPMPLVPPACTESECHGALAAAPALALPGSATQAPEAPPVQPLTTNPPKHKVKARRTVKHTPKHSRRRARKRSRGAVHTKAARR
ncbi:MAG TPA: hypothetical protein VGY76_03495 [Solirubrobacteraceae bacterium]|nr:hypothetical protein [Solirubrobacteraceae bacterium]